MSVTGRVLIVLPDHDKRVRIRNLCEDRLGLEVFSAANPIEGLAILQKMRPPDFILLSNQPLPIMTCEEFIAWKNRLPEIADIPVIFLSLQTSGFLPQGVSAEAIEPISSGDLTRLIEKYRSKEEVR